MDINELGHLTSLIRQEVEGRQQLFTRGLQQWIEELIQDKEDERTIAECEAALEGVDRELEEHPDCKADIADLRKALREAKVRVANRASREAFRRAQARLAETAMALRKR